MVRAIAYTPVDTLQGPAQKILYVHVPSAWIAFLAYAVTAICSGLYLWLRQERFDLLAASSAEVGLVCTTVVLITGPLWAKPVWGAWWTWDARLTSTLFLWFVYAAYIVMRTAVESLTLRANYSAVIGVIGALLIPFINISVNLFRTAHPKNSPAMPESMTITLLLSTVAFTVLYGALFKARYHLAVALSISTNHDSRQ